MTLDEVIQIVKVGYLSAVSNMAKASNESIIVMANEAIMSLHTSFNIRTEQAVILVPQNRKTFEISLNDKNVLMASLRKLAKAEMILDENESKKELLAKIAKQDKNINAKVLLEAEKYDNTIFDKLDTEVLSLLSVSDELGTEYDINTKNVYALDQKTLYFPLAKPGSLIYVDYKPKPRLSTELDSEVDVPDTLLGVLYAFVALKTVSSIDMNSQFMPQIVSTYNKRMEEAILQQAVLADTMDVSKNHWKGLL